MPLDEADRSLAESGMGPDPGGEIRRVRRYETSCLRRLEWAFSQLKKGRRDAPDPDRGAHQPQALPAEYEDDPDDADEFRPAPSSMARGSSDNLVPQRVPHAAAPAADLAAASGPSRNPFSLAGALRDPGRGGAAGRESAEPAAARRADSI